MGTQEELVSGLIDAFRSFERTKWKHTPHMAVRPSEMMLLFCLKKNPTALGGLRASEISEILKLAPPTITPLLNSLEDAGYIERLPDQRDRRVVLIKTTPKGDSLVEDARQRFVGNMKELVQFLGDDNSKELIRLLHLTFEFFKQKRNAESNGRMNNDQIT